MVVNQVVVKWILGLHTYILNCVSFLISSSQFVHGLNVIQIEPLWWLWKWVPDCADPIPSWSTTIGMQFPYPGLHYDCTGMSDCKRIVESLTATLYRFTLHCIMVYGGRWSNKFQYCPEVALIWSCFLFAAICLSLVHWCNPMNSLAILPIALQSNVIELNLAGC